MNEYDWDFIMGPCGDPLADIREEWCPPYSDADIERWGNSDEKRRAMERRNPPKFTIKQH